MVCSFNTTSIKVYILEWLQYNYPLKCAWKNSVPLLVCLPPEGYTVLKIMGWGMKITSPFSTSLIFKKSSSLLVWIFIFDKFSCVSSRDFGRDGYVRLLRLYTAFETLFISIRLQTVLDHRLLEEFEDTKGVIRIRKSKKHRQHNGLKKKHRQHNGLKKMNNKTNLDQQKTAQKTKNRATRTSLKTWGGLRFSGSVNSSCSTSGTRRVTLATNPVISH